MFAKYIDVEAKRMSSMSIDIDNFRTNYLETDSINNINILYPGYELTTIEKHLYKLIYEGDKVSFDRKWNQRPDYASYDLYGVVNYWFIILFINNINCIEEFIYDNHKELIIPSIRSLQELLRDKIPLNEIENNYYKEKQAPLLYRLFPLTPESFSITEAENALIDSSSSIPDPTCIFKENTENIELTATDISNKYIDLAYSPLNHSSITLQIEGYTTIQSYGYDYVLKTNENRSMKRISWSISDCSFGNGMEHLLDIGDVLQIRYLYPELGCSPCYETGNILDGGIY